MREAVTSPISIHVCGTNRSLFSHSGAPEPRVLIAAGSPHWGIKACWCHSPDETQTRQLTTGCPYTGCKLAAAATGLLFFLVKFVILVWPCND